MVKPKKDRNLKLIDGRWYVDVTFDKKRVRMIGGDTKEKARLTLAKLKLEKLNEKLGFKKPEKKPDILFSKFADEFIELYAKQNKRSWQRDLESLKHLKPFFGQKMLADIGPQMAENYKAKRKADESMRETPVSEGTINREITLLKTIFSKAVEWGRIEKNPMSRVKKFKENQKDMRILDDREMIKLIDAAPSHIRPIIIIAANTGMRKMEIFSLKWEHVNFKNGSIFIKDSKSSDREVPMNYMVFDTLKGLPQDHEYVFSNPKTETHLKDASNSFKTACKDVNIEGFRFHDLRHTAASRMIQAGVDLVTVSKILGHSSIQMTMKYCHPTTEIMRDAVKKLAEIYEQTRQKVDSPTEEVTIKGTVNHLKSGH